MSATSKQKCPNRFGHGIQPGCIACKGTGEFSLPESAWRILAKIATDEEIRPDERNVAHVLSVRGLCRLMDRPDSGYEITRVGLNAVDEHNGLEVLDSGPGGRTVRGRA